MVTHSSTDYDLALLRLEAIRRSNRRQGQGAVAEEGLPVARLAERAPRKGDPVVLVAQPGFTRLPRQQSCLGRVWQTPAHPWEAQRDWGALLHSCIVYAGNSGGPLLNAQGEIVGMHVTGDCFHLQAIQEYDSRRGRLKQNGERRTNDVLSAR